MPGKRQPTDLVVANGRKHLSRSEEAERRAGEVRVEPPKTAKAPKWLPEGLRKDFRALGKRLIAAGLYTDLDADTLGRYLLAHHQWLIATQETEAALRKRDSEAAEDWAPKVIVPSAAEYSTSPEKLQPGAVSTRSPSKAPFWIRLRAVSASPQTKKSPSGMRLVLFGSDFRYSRTLSI